MPLFSVPCLALIGEKGWDIGDLLELCFYTLSKCLTIIWFYWTRLIWCKDGLVLLVLGIGICCFWCWWRTLGVLLVLFFFYFVEKGLNSISEWASHFDGLFRTEGRPTYSVDEIFMVQRCFNGIVGIGDRKMLFLVLVVSIWHFFLLYDRYCLFCCVVYIACLPWLFFGVSDIHLQNFLHFTPSSNLTTKMSSLLVAFDRLAKFSVLDFKPKIEAAVSQVRDGRTVYPRTLLSDAVLQKRLAWALFVCCYQTLRVASRQSWFGFFCFINFQF